jgi:3-isopropylmalate dehydrogenase
MKLNIAILAGDGIGPEVTAEAVKVLKTIAEFGGHDFTFREALIGGVAITVEGTPLPPKTIEVALSSDAVLLGAVADNSPLRPEVTKGVDILFVRELLGGLYFGAPRWWNKETGEAINTMRYTRDEVTRVAKIAFELAQKRRKKLTQVDKANVLECSQLWRATVSELATQYPDVTVEHQLVDSMAIHLMNTPRNFDVVLTENLFGDILSDESGVISGSLGMLPSATIGGKVNLYEPVHGSAPDIAGQGKANPIGAILTAAMVLRHSARLEQEAVAIETAVSQVLADGHRTSDIARGGTAANTTTTQMGKLVHDALAQAIDRDQSMHAV